MKAFLGIDPGQSGGIAIVSDGLSPWAVKMPATERDLWDTLHALRAWSDREAVAVIEAVHAMPKQGVTSTFTFGKSYGGLRMALIGNMIPFRDVQPRKWQQVMGCLTGGDKNISKAKAQQLFPSIKVTHALADALLLAEWLRREYSRTPEAWQP
jgi:crossover junction endodeoxyribonuclease RuvC